MEGLGHQVVRIQESQTPTGQVVKQALRCSLFVWTHTHNWKIQGNVSISDLLEALRLRNIPSLAYHLDLFTGIPERWERYRQDPYLTGGIQHFFTVDPKLADWLNANTNTIGHYLPAGVLEEECYILPPTEPFDVAFVGSRRYHSSWPHRPMLIDWLTRTYKDRFRLYGQDAGMVVRGVALNQVYANAKVVVGDSLCPGYNYPDYASDRLYETPGRGGMMIFPRIPGVGTQFVEGEEMAFWTFNDFGELGRKIDYYLDHDEEREKIRLAGHERVKRDHTYTSRWKHILQTIQADVPTEIPKAPPYDPRLTGPDRRLLQRRPWMTQK